MHEEIVGMLLKPENITPAWLERRLAQIAAEAANDAGHYETARWLPNRAYLRQIMPSATERPPGISQEILAARLNWYVHARDAVQKHHAGQSPQGTLPPHVASKAQLDELQRRLKPPSMRSKKPRK